MKEFINYTEVLALQQAAKELKEENNQLNELNEKLEKYLADPDICFKSAKLLFGFGWCKRIHDEYYELQKSVVLNKEKESYDELMKDMGEHLLKIIKKNYSTQNEKESMQYEPDIQINDLKQRIRNLYDFKDVHAYYIKNIIKRIEALENDDHDDNHNDNQNDRYDRYERLRQALQRRQ